MKNGIPCNPKMMADMSGSGEPIRIKSEMGKVKESKKPMSDPPVSTAPKSYMVRKRGYGPKAVFVKKG